MKLSDLTLITGDEYMKLKNPEFVGQTTVKEGMYYMCWRSEGKLFKTHNKLKS
jgi:hypothetical protein